MDTRSIFSFGASEPRVRVPLAVNDPGSVSGGSAGSTSFYTASSHRGESTSWSGVNFERSSGGASSFGAPPSCRLRRRGKFTKSLERAVVATTWWKDLSGSGGASPARAWLDSFLSGTDVEVVNEKTLEIPTGEGGVRSLQLVQVPFENGSRARRALWVCPELVSKLVAVRLFRAPSAGLLASLRSRARLWADELGVDTMDLVRFLPGSVVLASLPAPDEVAAVGALRGAAGRWGVDVLGPLASGRLVSSPARRFGDYTKGPLAWLLGKSDERLLAAGVPQLQMPA